MAVSIIQLSKVAGVSKSTVSRVLNHDPRVSPEAVRAVRGAVETTGYLKPQRLGRPRRAPSGISKGSIALLFPDTNPNALRTILSGRLLHGIEEVFRRRGITLVLAGLPEVGRLPQSIEQRMVDGVIIRGHPSEANRRALFEGLSRLPCVHLFEPRGAVPANWDVVLEDNEAIAQAALDFLVGKGRRSLAFLNLMPDHPSLRHRGRAFVDAAADANISVRSVSASGPAKELVARLLAERPEPIDGLFIPGPDNEVVEVYRALSGTGLRIGTDLDLISCNNDHNRLATLDPALTNIDIHAEAIGRAAAETLLWRLQNPREPQRRLSVAPRVGEPGRPSSA